MDLRKISENLIRTFEEKGVRYALIGGCALKLRGVERETEDLNFLVHRGDLHEVDRAMLALEYEPQIRSENLSRYRSHLAAFGEVGFIHAFRDATLEMLDRAEALQAFDGALTVRVARPEDLIGLKVQALANDARRLEIEMADIEALLAVHGSDLDWKRIGAYFALFELTPLYNDLERLHRRPAIRTPQDVSSAT